MTRRYFILHNRTVIPAAGHRAWTEWFKSTEPIDRTVATTDISDVYVSTAFIGLDRCLFQTMVFGGPMDGEVSRYTTYNAAQRGHELMVARVALTQKDFD